MNILRSVSQSVLGNQQDTSQPSGAETVERLLDRVQSSTLLEDRRDACRALKALSKKYRILVGAHGMDTLIQILESDRNDHEIVNYALEALMNVTANETYNEEGEEISVETQDDKIGEQFTEIFIKRMENISLILSMLDEFDFQVCFPAMKLICNLLTNRPKEMQEAILVIPNGISKLMDKLSDNREVIRNDTLVILTQLSIGNTNTQKIIVFENVYDRIFEIIRQEDYADGGIVVEDCLILMLNLLKNNSSNQTLFQEGNYMQKMTDFFRQLADCESDWLMQKVTNVRYMLKVVRTLVSPKNSALVNVCQRKMHTCQLLPKLCTLLMAEGVPADILTDTISAVADIIRGCKENQDFFASVTAPSNPPRPVIVVLLMSMVNDKQPFMLRAAVLYCYQSFLFRNVSSQSQIVQTLLPQTTDNITNQITAGQLLCGGLFSMDPLSNWFSAIALSHVLHDNVPLKEQLLRVQLARGVGSPSVSLLQQCISLLEGGGKLLTRLGLLQLLCVWIAHCPIAVSHFLNISTVVPYLTAFLNSNEHDEYEVICQGICAFLLGLCGHFNDGSVTSFTSEALKNLISNRVGVENFTDKLENILRTEANSRAAKSPQLNAQQPSDIVFDHEFARLFKSLESAALKAVTPKGAEDAITLELIKCKEIICEQEVQIKSLQQTVETLSQQLNSHVQQNDNVVQMNGVAGNSSIPDSCQKLVELQKLLDEMTYARDYYYYAMVEKENQLQTQNKQVGESSENSSNLEIDNFRKQLEDMQLILHQRDGEITYLKDNSSYVIKNNLEKTKTADKISETKKEDSETELLFEKLQEDYATLQTEQEDTLIFLSEQEAKLGKYKEKLLNYGYLFSDDDSSDSDDFT